MTDFSLNSLYGSSTSSATGLDYVNMKNQLYSNRISGLMGGLGNSNSVFSPAFLLQISDAKLVTPQIINNYLNKAEEAYGPEEEPEKERVRYKTIVDEIIEKANAPEEETPVDVSAELPPEGTEVASEPSSYEHYGIVGEIFDKYA